jgi:hypothetical protein
MLVIYKLLVFVSWLQFYQILTMKINKIIAIAIDEYDNDELNKIQNAKSDVASIISILTEKYLFEDVEFLFKKKDTTRKSLFNKLNQFFTNALEDENILLIYAGHGEYNDILKTSYWQPSDCDPSDVSTWINIGDILTFVNASEAFHVAVISDSCFSGAIFETQKRGGGIQAFERKKSRLALTSGGVEKVSDGAKGNKSPFAENLIKQLTENGLEELPFSVLSNNLIMSFNQDRSQTPMYGALNNVGHQGGSFIFKLKGTETVQPDDVNNYLKLRLGNLFIPIGEKHIELINQIRPINKEKHELVLQQRYGDAAKLRDEEKRLEDLIYNTSSNYISRIFLSTRISEVQSHKIRELEVSVSAFEEEYKAKQEKVSVSVALLEKEFLEENQETTKNDNKLLLSLAELEVGNFDFLNPSREFFTDEKHNLIQKYLEGILSLYTYFLEIKASSKIYELEVKILYRWYSDEIDEFITLKQIDIQLLIWIRN